MTEHQLEFLTNPVVVLCQGTDTCLDSVAYRCRDCNKFYCTHHGQEHGRCIGVQGLPDIKDVQL